MTLDPVAILAMFGIAGEITCAPVTGGLDTSIWRVEHRGTRYALRVFPLGKEQQQQREIAVMRATAEAGIPVPIVHAAGTWQGHPALLLSWCAGRTIVDEWRARPWAAWSLGAQFGRMQAAIHAVPVSEELRQIGHEWISRAGSDEAALQARLRTMPPHADALLHLDYHLLNVMADRDGITAVLDWANARVGDPRADLARTVVVLRLSPLPPGMSRRDRVLARLARRIFEHAWRRGYERVAGPIGDLALFYAWAGADLVRDLTPRLGQPNVWIRERDLAPFRRWTAHWKRRAGVRT